MDITCFINSNDIREHHRAIGYEYTAIEAAWLVSQCHSATLEEKHDAWRWIIENMPDCEIKNCGGRVTVPTESVHKVLAEYMEMENAFIERFKDASGGHMYIFREWYRSQKYLDPYCDVDCFFASYEDCVKYIQDNEDAEDISVVEIRRRLPGEDSIASKGGSITVNIEGLIMSVVPEYSEKDSYSDFFDLLWFAFPVPFERGDIVYRKSVHQPDEHTPIVIDSIVFPHGWNKEEYFAKRREFGDTSDMNVWGYAADMEWSSGYHGPYNEVWWNYMDAEYYHEELTGIERVLGLISNWLKGKLGDSVDLLMAGYHHIMLEEMLARSTPVLYTDEALKLAGFEVKKKEEISEQEFEQYYQVVMSYRDEILSYLNTQYNVSISSFRGLQDFLISIKQWKFTVGNKLYFFHGCGCSVYINRIEICCWTFDHNENKEMDLNCLNHDKYKIKQTLKHFQQQAESTDMQ